MGALSLRKISKISGDTRILNNINLDIDKGSFLILVGPSGCGKSTLLNLIAGLDEPSNGDVLIGDEVVTQRSPKDRDIAMVFQSYALYPNMTVRENIAFGLQMRKVSKAEQEATIARVATMLQIEPLLDRKPKALSGGQRQRVAMGRALARNPALFLFDEPLSNLDAKLRVEMRTEIKRLHQRLGTTMVYVTHDQIEAMTLGDRMAVMKGGEIQQFGTPDEIYNAPANLFVAGFIGSPAMNILPCTLVVADGRTSVSLQSGMHDAIRVDLGVATDAHAALHQHPVLLGVRPEHLSDADPLAFNCGTTQLDATVEMLEPTGPDTHVSLTLNGVPAIARSKPSAAQPIGATMRLSLSVANLHLFNPDSGLRI
ncbi:sn-glycerol-3-phosphate ABC transporter ATP-binding protein UgpC [Burkholderiaceae bacterium DAT-1]|nr:sn-glycerol-3-phosphate ABC transporter ATP-binding protein UgpC [Burkholderiaceae bacterium DAT-1]